MNVTGRAGGREGDDDADILLTVGSTTPTGEARAFIQSTALAIAAAVQSTRRQAQAVTFYGQPQRRLCDGFCSSLRGIYYNKWESVKSVLFHIDRLNVTHLIMMRKINFYRRLRVTENCILYNVLCCFCHVAVTICVLIAVFRQKSLPVELVNDSFKSYVES